MSTEHTDEPTLAVDSGVAERLTAALTELNGTLERARNLRYLQMAERPGRFLAYNFLGGIARGVGFAFGATVVGALILYLLGRLQLVPWIGKWVAEIVAIVEQYRAIAP